MDSRSLLAGQPSWNGDLRVQWETPCQKRLESSRGKYLLGFVCTQTHTHVLIYHTHTHRDKPNRMIRSENTPNWMASYVENSVFLLHFGTRGISPWTENSHLLLFGGGSGMCMCWQSYYIALVGLKPLILLSQHSQSWICRPFPLHLPQHTSFLFLFFFILFYFFTKY